MTTIFERTNTALGTLSPAIPHALGKYLTASGADFPDTFITFTLITGIGEQHADDKETERTHRVQISIFARSGLVGLPNVNAAMIAQGFKPGPERQLPYDPDTHHFGLAKDYFYLEQEA